LGHKDTAEKLEAYKTSNNLPTTAGTLYYDANTLNKAAGIKVYRESDMLRGYLPPMPVRFVAEDYVGEEVLIRSVAVRTHDYSSGWLTPYEHIMASEVGGVAADMLELPRASFDNDLWDDYVFLLVDGYDVAVVDLGGLAQGAKYAVYERGATGEQPLKEGAITSGKPLALPEALGQYTICLSIVWGVEERNIACQYWFGLDRVR
jgi:hypothetical protein